MVRGWNNLERLELPEDCLEKSAVAWRRSLPELVSSGAPVSRLGLPFGHQRENLRQAPTCKSPE